MSKVYEIIKEKIVKKLEEGTIPWRKPWRNGIPVSWDRQRPYRGINTMLLEPGEYLTFDQAKKAGGHVKKGEKGHCVVFWKWVSKEDEDGEKKTFPILRYYTVFEVSQCEGIERKRKDQAFSHKVNKRGENILKKYKDGPEIKKKSGKAFYQPKKDIISVPPMKDYEKVEEYYSTLFHELVHSTGHEKRLGREGVAKVASFGSEKYSKEELVAELGSAMLCGVAGIDNEVIDNQAAYIRGWLKAIKNGDKNLVVQAAAKAQKAADYIQGIEFNEKEGE